MKRALSLILAALLLASSLMACGTTEPKETNAAETKSPETSAAQTDAPDAETTVPAPVISTDKLTENGIALAKIVLSASASDLEQYAAKELQYHIKKVSGADMEIVTEAPTDCMSVVIGTPNSVPALNELFPEDLAWLTTLEEDGKSYGDDGFAIHTTENALYIFGATERGALNGVYDFIEENMDVFWIRANEESGMIFDEQPTITITSRDYAVGHREKSPFSIRGWHLCGDGQNGEPHSDPATEIMMSRNKLNGKFAELGCNEHLWSYYETIGLEPFNLGHNLKYWVLNSPLYDPAITEYWNTDKDGNPYPLFPEQTNDITKYAQINFWSELTLETVTAGVLDFLSKNNTKTISVGVEDNNICTNPPMSDERFEYAPGQFVERNDPSYMSTVFFTFLNRVAQRVKAEYPDVIINTFAYWLVENPPVCEIEDNINIVIAPILEDMSSPITDPQNGNNVPVHAMMEKWKNVSNDVIIYNYYGSFSACKEFERPIWDRIQADFRYYASIGFNGTMPEGLTDARASAAAWDINALSFWIYSKLSWNPEEDVDALIVKFCDKYYGAASTKMQEYYRLLEKGWEEGESETYLWNFKLTADYYYDTFIYCTDLEDDMVNILTEAYNAAETDLERERIRPIKESYEKMYAQFAG